MLPDALDPAEADSVGAKKAWLVGRIILLILLNVARAESHDTARFDISKPFVRRYDVVVCIVEPCLQLLFGAGEIEGLGAIDDKHNIVLAAPLPEGVEVEDSGALAGNLISKQNLEWSRGIG